jgi:hypothetical protein
MTTTETRPDLNRNSDWIQTFGGYPFWPLDPHPEDVDIFDIAHALAFQCRYTGHVKRFYSVAEHSYHISHAVSPENALWGLLHDASEAYLCDIPRPLKRTPAFGKLYKEYEDQLTQCICIKFGLPFAEPTEIKEMDTRILFNEREALLSASVREWGLTGDPIPGLIIRAWTPEVAEIMFLTRFRELVGENSSPFVYGA